MADEDSKSIRFSSFRSLLKRNGYSKKAIEEILKWIYSDDIVLLTANNHELIKAVLFLKYNNFILPKCSSQIIQKARLIYKNINTYKHKQIEPFPFKLKHIL